MYIVDTTTKTVNVLCHPEDGFSLSDSLMKELEVRSHRPYQICSAIVVKKGDQLYILKYRHELMFMTYGDFMKHNWETVTKKHFNSGVKDPSPTGVDEPFYFAKYFIIDLGGEKKC